MAAGGRNHPCPCGSGRKYKRCCLETEKSQRTLFEAEEEFQDGDDVDPVEFTAHTMAAIMAERGRGLLDDPSREFLQENPGCLLFFLDGFLNAGDDAADEESERLADAYYYLLGIELNVLRINLDRRSDWARDMREDFENRIIEAIRGGEASVDQIRALANLMMEQKIKPGPEMAAACGGAYSQEPDWHPEDLNPMELCAQIAALCNNDSFLISDKLFSSVRFAGALSAPLISVLLGVAQSCIREAAALGVLDADAEVRSVTGEALVQSADALAPPTLRRLIAIRRWLPESERAPIDRAIRAARLAHVECAQWAPGAAVSEIRASAPDGAGAQMAMIVTGAQGGHRLSGILFKRGSGIADAWTGDPQSMREIKEMLNDRSSGVSLLPVSRRYLDAMVGYYLADALRHGAPPPARLLALAEVVEAPHWQPGESGWRELLSELMGEIRADLLAPAAVNNIIATSGKWGMKRQWAISWAEDSEEVVDLLDRFGRRSVKAVREAIIDKILEKRRDVWAERFTLTALWMKEAQRRADLPWEHFAISAQRMANGMALRNFPLMQRIAEATAYF